MLLDFWLQSVRASGGLQNTASHNSIVAGKVREAGASVVYRWPTMEVGDRIISSGSSSPWNEERELDRRATEEMFSIGFLAVACLLIWGGDSGSERVQVFGLTVALRAVS
jgi:hypothetical protein